MTLNPATGAARHAALSTAEAAQARGSIVLIPIGAIEQHGPHLPLGTDIWLADSVARDVAERCPGVLVTEPLPVGCSAHHLGFAGTLSLRVDTMMRVLVDVATSLAEDGFVPVFVNGHGGNRSPLGAALQQLLEHGVEAWGITYFELIADEAILAFDGDYNSMGHACALETSLSLALWPQLVHSDRIPPRGGEHHFPNASMFTPDKVVHHKPFEELDQNGIVGDPGKATDAVGQTLYKLAVERLVTAVESIRTTLSTPGLK